MEAPLKAWIRALERTAPIEQRPLETFPVIIESLAVQHGGITALSAPNGKLTYRELAQGANRYARWGVARGLAKGSVVCLLMPNRPDYLAIWIGLSRIGVTTALLNTQLTGAALAHCIRVVAPQVTIVDATLEEALRSADPHLPDRAECWMLGRGQSDLPRLDEAAAQLGATWLDPGDQPLPTLSDPALYIYTSGTTGLPKAAKVSHFRIMQWSHWFAGLMNVTTADRMFNCLPLYHSVGGVVATGATLVGGGTVVLRERFSPREFWSDVCEEKCTLFQYIGELCRYLLSSPAQPGEIEHSLRLCCGNGLRAEVWRAFQQRFRIPRILEYYAATEGNFSLYNCEERPGSIGRIPAYLAHRLPVALVKYDMAYEAPHRDAAGRCVRCQPNEIGEALGKITDAEGHMLSRFEGYTDSVATERKVLHHVFEEGDAWFRTGDLMSQDSDGFYYFIDRVGDTFRWKGENVSTTEVAGAILSCAGTIDVVVYGVSVPAADGRAGMAAIVVMDDFDLRRLHARLAELLPEYARPLFIRIVTNIELTGTFKLNKQALAQWGFDPGQSADQFYYYDRETRIYKPLTGDVYEQIRSGNKRL